MFNELRIKAMTAHAESIDQELFPLFSSLEEYERACKWQEDFLKRSLAKMAKEEAEHQEWREMIKAQNERLDKAWRT
ncbi:MAG: hypothetical protein ACI8WB_003952 [Phenylobacterium sp.]|jgi:hypothetical protein